MDSRIGSKSPTLPLKAPTSSLSLPMAPPAASEAAPAAREATPAGAPSALGLPQRAASAVRPDSGKTWGDPSFKRDLNFGHQAVDGQLFKRVGQTICWADTCPGSPRALTPDQWANMPNAQKAGLRSLLAMAGESPEAIAALEGRMREGEASASRVAPPPPPGTWPTALPEGVRRALEGDFNGRHGGQCKVFVERQTGAYFPNDVSARSMADPGNHPGYDLVQAPRPGDIFVSSKGRWGHTGFVKSVHDDGSITVVDSNAGGGERIREHTYDAGYVRAHMRGYLRRNEAPIKPYWTAPLS